MHPADRTDPMEDDSDTTAEVRSLLNQTILHAQEVSESAEQLQRLLLEYRKERNSA
jgi:hypothetical protein